MSTYKNQPTIQTTSGDAGGTAPQWPEVPAPTEPVHAVPPPPPFPSGGQQVAHTVVQGQAGYGAAHPEAGATQRRSFAVA